MIGHKSIVRRRMNNSELWKTFRNSHDFRISFDVDFYYSKQFFRYIFKTFINKGSINNFVGRIIRCIKKSSSDYSVYKFIRDELSNKGITVKALIEKEIEYYPHFIDKKLRILNRIISKHNVNMNNIRLLDVGTESLEFLNRLQSKFSIPNGNIIGINIDDGFCHYDVETFESNKKDDRFQIYDGKHIDALDDEFDFITAFSIIHHIDTNDLYYFAHELARVCAPGGYLFIKDVNLCCVDARLTFTMQHYLYTNGILTPGTGSCINDKVTRDNTLDVFYNVGFDVVCIENVKNFNSSYYCLLHRSDY